MHGLSCQSWETLDAEGEGTAGMRVVAGTNPINGVSVLRTITVTSLSGLDVSAVAELIE